MEPILTPNSPWYHPHLYKEEVTQHLSREEIHAMAYHYFLKFMPFFRNQKEGSLKTGLVIEFSTRMKSKLGLSLLFERKMRLNLTYFATCPSLMPYTIFHELVHQWLYDCWYDPNHTARFYKKMEDFEKTNLPVDTKVHIHSRLLKESKYIYQCPSCENIFFNAKAYRGISYCGHCHDLEKGKNYLNRVYRTEQRVSA